MFIFGCIRFVYNFPLSLQKVECKTL
ncbi:MAG: helix-turn-helix domain-containing protein [Rikenellaceae bacterium]|nr:helix-turn-helix domain-containing protein [Rikenellaceae bacterium]